MRVKVIAMDDLHIQILKGMANELGYLELNACDTVVTMRYLYETKFCSFANETVYTLSLSKGS